MARRRKANRPRNPVDAILEGGHPDVAPETEASNGHVDGDPAPALTAPPESLRMPPEEEYRHKAQAFDAVYALNLECEQALAAYRLAKDDCLAKKKVYDSLTQRLHETISQARNPEPFPLVDGQANSNSNGRASPAGDESWRSVRLEDALLGLNPSFIRKLNDGLLYTVGELANYTAEDGGRRRLTDIPGIGPATVTKIDAALDGFWERRRASQVAAPEPAADVEQEEHEDDGDE